MQKSIFRCSNCGSKNFAREVTESYNHYIDGDNLQITVEDDWHHDISFSAIICDSCGFDNTMIFKNVDLNI